jgi:uncharacterized protein (DUF58 family)
MYVSPKLAIYAGLVGLGTLAALALGRPEPVVLTIPFALASMVALVLARTPRVEVHAVLDRERALEGETVHLDIDLHSRDRERWLQVYAPAPAGLHTDTETVLGIQLGADEHRRVRVPIRCDRWGVYRLGHVWLRSHDALGFFVSEGHVDPGSSTQLRLRVYPRPEQLRTLIQPKETQVFAGNRLSRRAGEGIEFANVRPFMAGDVVRRVNWRATTRLGGLYVNEQHLERNADVLLFLDAFSDQRGAGSGTLEMAVRATATLAARYLQTRDRVGLLSFGGSLRWLLTNMGVRQEYRIVDALLDTEILLSYAWKGIDHLPPRTLPPKAFIVAVTPLLDPRTVQALLDLRGRGFDLAILEVSPEPFVSAGREHIDHLAFRLWRLQREVQRLKFSQMGVPVAVWTFGNPLAPVLEEVSTFRRSARVVHA